MDWDEFAARIPHCTPVKVDWVEGLLMDVSPHWALDWNADFRAGFEDYQEGDEDRDSYAPSALRWQRTNVTSQHTGYTVTRAERLQYFIGGEWLTFIQVMCRPAE